MLDQFTLNQLRTDVAYHSDWSIICEIEDHVAMIDTLLEALIGSQAMDLLSAPGSTWCYYIGYAELWVGDPETCQAIWLG